MKLRLTYLKTLISIIISLAASCSDHLKETVGIKGPVIGERVDGPANFRDTVGGKVIFVIDDNVLVETSVSRGNWLVAGLEVRLNPKQLKALMILPGSSLISLDGKKVGQTKDTVQVWMGNEEEQSGFIGAYTPINNIKRQSVPEKVLADEMKKKKLSLNFWKPFMADFKFEAAELNTTTGFKEAFIYESVVEDISPRDRITLMFHMKDMLVGFIHSRPIKVSKSRTYNLVRGHSLTIVSNQLKKDQIDKLIKSKIEFYNSID